MLTDKNPADNVASVESYLTVQLNNSVLYYEYKYQSESRSQSINRPINDGKWHDIIITKDNVTIDSSVVYQPRVSSNLPVRYIYIGGVDDVEFFRKALVTSSQYNGCLQAVRFKGKVLATQAIGSGGDPSQAVNNMTAASGCNGSAVCDPNPCKYGGSCNDLWNAYNCSCVPGFFGTNCGLFGCSVSSNCPNNTECVDLPGKHGTVACECHYFL